jgi:hypothetical protein
VAGLVMFLFTQNSTYYLAVKFYDNFIVKPWAQGILLEEKRWKKECPTL